MEPTTTCTNCGYPWSRHDERRCPTAHASMFLGNPDAEALAAAVLKAAGSELRHYMPTTKAAIIRACAPSVDWLSYIAGSARMTLDDKATTKEGLRGTLTGIETRARQVLDQINGRG